MVLTTAAQFIAAGVSSWPGEGHQRVHEFAPDDPARLSFSGSETGPKGRGLLASL
jgi:hypothetical protein